MNVINQMTDLLDDMAMAFYHSLVIEKPKISYLTCLSKTLNSFYDEDILEDEKLLEEDLEIINKSYEEITNITINEEEMRKALLLLEIKAYKHSNLSLDNITPDGVGIIFTFLIDLQKNIKFNNMLDITVGSGNLSMVISNYTQQDFNLIGIENDEDLCEYLVIKANFLEKNFDIRLQDCLLYNFNNIDCIVGDLPSYEYINEGYSSPLYDAGVREFQYLAIERHMFTGHDDTMAYYLVNNDFFTLKDNEIFKKEFSKFAYFKAIIVLPPNFSQGLPKMILVVAKRSENMNKKVETNIFTMPNYHETDKWQNTLRNIKAYLEE